MYKHYCSTEWIVDSKQYHPIHNILLMLVVWQRRVTEDVNENNVCAKVGFTIGESFSFLSVSASPLPG